MVEEIISVKGIESKASVELIESMLKALKGVEKARASMVDEAVFVAFNPQIVNLGEIKSEIAKTGNYTVETESPDSVSSDNSASSAGEMPQASENHPAGAEGSASQERERSITASSEAELEIKNMVCTSCEKIIEKSLNGMNGVEKAKASYSQGIVKVSYNPEKVSLNEIKDKIKEAGYSVKNSGNGKGLGIQGKYIAAGLVALALLLFFYFIVSTFAVGLNVSIPELDQQTSVVLIFIVGLLTGFHCIGMCGSFVLGYTAKSRQQNPKALNISMHAKYALGKMISYSVIGGIFGLVGSIFVFTPELRAGIALFAGAFLIFFGLKMLNVFPILRKFSLPQGFFDKFKVGPLKQKRDNGPMIVGLLNGLFIACGPLQAMYILAASTGSMVNGASLLFAFGIGTLIPMMGFGVFASFITHSLQNKIVRISALIVIVMGLFMVNNGLALTGNALNASTITGIFSPVSSGNGSPSYSNQASFSTNSPYQIINMDVTGSGWSPNSFILKKGVPVKWVINGKELNSCNSSIRVPAYNLSFKISPGIQTIEFTPDKAGVIQWSCWMGMIQGTFVVRDDVGVDASGKIVLEAKVQQEAAAQAASAPKPKGGCGCGGGSGSSCHA